MILSRVHFSNTDGQQLAGILEFPADHRPHGFALFAHCFTCGKNLNAARNIARALNVAGIAVLRFDFTGLGESEGEFAETGFDSNLDDLTSAARFLAEQYQPPALLIGHSLGGAAALAVATDLPSVRAVVTIGAPFDPAHVTHLLAGAEADLAAHGKATVHIGGLPITIGQRLVEELKSRNNAEHIHNLRRALLVMHSPQDHIVDIDNAARIYQAALHPKSFVSLDNADHLLSKASDSCYAGQLIAAWAARYVPTPAATELASSQQVVARIDDQPGFTTDIRAGHHGLLADEPGKLGGNDLGPSPYDYLIAALGACTAMTLKMYAQRHRWEVREIKVHLCHNKIHAADCECDLKSDNSGRIDRISRILEIDGDLSEAQCERLREIADRCPVHRTLQNDILITTEITC